MSTNPDLADQEQDIDALLSKANLCRMRGNYDEAAEVCQRILRFHPANFTAHVLLGDISVESGKLESARDWYDHSLEIQPESQLAHSKRDQVNTIIEQRDTAQSVANLGIPTTKPRMWMLIGVITAFAALLAATSYLAGRNIQRDQTKGNIQNEPIVIKLDNGDKKPESGTLKPDEKVTPDPIVKKPETTTQHTKQVVAEDEKLYETITTKCTKGNLVTGCILDPRSGHLTVTFTQDSTVPTKDLASELALSIFEQLPEVKTMTLRGIKESKIDWLGDAKRTENMDLTNVLVGESPPTVDQANPTGG